LSNTSTLPWLVIGDFNELMGMSEKEGGRGDKLIALLKLLIGVVYGILDSLAPSLLGFMREVRGFKSEKS